MGFLVYLEHFENLFYNILTEISKVSKSAKIRNRYNQVPHLTQDTNGKVTNSQLDTTSESQEVSPFPAGDHKSHINRPAQRHGKHKTEKNNIKDPQKRTALERSVHISLIKLLLYQTFDSRILYLNV